MANIEGGGNIGFGGKPSKTPYLGFGITAEQHKAIMESRGRPLTESPLGSKPRPSNSSRFKGDSGEMRGFGNGNRISDITGREV